jgi:hypothetical protein
MSRKNAVITPDKGLGAALARSAAAQFSNTVQRARTGRSYADILSDLYIQTDQVLADIATSGDPPLKRAEALRTVAKILPLLQQAEKNARTSIKRKAIEQLTDAELDKYARAMQPRKSRFPLNAGNPSGNTNPVSPEQNPKGSELSHISDEDLERELEILEKNGGVGNG